MILWLAADLLPGEADTDAAEAKKRTGCRPARKESVGWRVIRLLFLSFGQPAFEEIGALKGLPERHGQTIFDGKLVRKTMRFYFHFGIACLSFV